MILPVTARIKSNHHLEIGGCDAIELAREFGTPLFVYDEVTLRTQCRRYRGAFESLHEDVEVIYASKAFIATAICRLVTEEGLSIDVSSGGELHVAEKAGCPPEKVYLHGNNKSREELRYALRFGVGHVVVDSIGELEILDMLAAEAGVRASVLLRITPGIEAHTHSYIQTGGFDTKFGFGLLEGMARDAVKRALELGNLDLKGIHAHIGSQIFALHSYEKAIEVLVKFISEMKDEFGVEMTEFDTGGGLGIPYAAADEPSTIEEYAAVVVENIKRDCKKFGLAVPRIMVEPGRSIVGNACVTLYEVGTVKEIPGVRTYVSVDGGMSDNIRPMLYGASYEALIAGRADAQPDTVVTVAGKHCESGDVLIKDVRLPHPAPGDILATPATGAYGYVMASNYNKQCRPAVVMAADGKARVIVRRETYEDLVRLDRPLTSSQKE